MQVGGRKYLIFYILNIFRAIISHDIHDRISDIHVKGISDSEKTSAGKGLVSAQLFREICKDEEKSVTVRTYLLALDLAVELTDGNLFIPSIVSDRNEVNHIHKREQLCS